jgi:hypothetical protein
MYVCYIIFLQRWLNIIDTACCKIIYCMLLLVDWILGFCCNLFDILFKFEKKMITKYDINFLVF